LGTTFAAAAAAAAVVPMMSFCRHDKSFEVARVEAASCCAVL